MIDGNVFNDCIMSASHTFWFGPQIGKVSFDKSSSREVELLSVSSVKKLNTSDLLVTVYAQMSTMPYR